MKPRPIEPGRESPLAEAVFVALETLYKLAPEKCRDIPMPRVSFDDLYRLASDPDMTMSEELSLGLANDPRLRADLRRLIGRSSPGGLLLAAAASSGAITTRHGTSFRMTLRESHADRSQIYVVIELAAKSAAAPRALFVINQQAACQKVPLPSPLNGTVQLLLDADSAIVAALRDPATEVFVQ